MSYVDEQRWLLETLKYFELESQNKMVNRSKIYSKVVFATDLEYTYLIYLYSTGRRR